MNFIDLAVVGGMGYGYLRGRTRGLDIELFRLINFGVVLVAGCSFFKLVARILSVLPGLKAENAGFAGFLLSGVVAFLVMRTLRKRLRSVLAAKFGGGSHRNAAGLMGLSRWAVGMVGLMAGLILSKADFLTRPLAESSWLGKLVSSLLGV